MSMMTLATEGTNPVPGMLYTHEEIALLANQFLKSAARSLSQGDLVRLIMPKLGNRAALPENLVKHKIEPETMVAAFLQGAGKAGYLRVKNTFWGNLEKNMISPVTDPALLQQLEAAVNQQLTIISKEMSGLEEQWSRFFGQIQSCRAVGKADAGKANFPLADALVEKTMMLLSSEKRELANRCNHGFGEEAERLGAILGLMADVDDETISRGSMAGYTIAFGLLGLAASQFVRLEHRDMIAKCKAYLRLFYAGIA